MSPAHCSLCCKVSTQPHLHPPSTPDTQTGSTHGCMCADSHTHKHMVSEMPSEPPDEKTPPHKQRLLMQGEALLFSGTMSVLTFLCLHIFKHQKAAERMEKKKSERHAIAASDMFRLIQALHSYVNLKTFSTPQSCSGVPLRIFDEDIFEWLTSLSHTCKPLTHKRHFTL